MKKNKEKSFLTYVLIIVAIILLVFIYAINGLISENKELKAQQEQESQVLKFSLETNQFCANVLNISVEELFNAYGNYKSQLNQSINSNL